MVVVREREGMDGVLLFLSCAKFQIRGSGVKIPTLISDNFAGVGHFRHIFSPFCSEFVEIAPPALHSHDLSAVSITPQSYSRKHHLVLSSRKSSRKVTGQV